jgi:DNA-binding response OmpR family regulator
MAKRILIVEDEKPLAKAMQIKITKAGFEADVVSDGTEALEHVEKHTYDLILLDLIMPSMNGFDFLSSLKKKGKSMPVIVLSNLSQEEDKKKAKDLGAVDFLVKSNIPIAEIVEIVERQVST